MYPHFILDSKACCAELCLPKMKGTVKILKSNRFLMRSF